jgi:hypothetical protein
MAAAPARPGVLPHKIIVGRPQNVCRSNVEDMNMMDATDGPDQETQKHQERLMRGGKALVQKYSSCYVIKDGVHDTTLSDQ